MQVLFSNVAFLDKMFPTKRFCGNFLTSKSLREATAPQPLAAIIKLANSQAYNATFNSYIVSILWLMHWNYCDHSLVGHVFPVILFDYSVVMQYKILAFFGWCTQSLCMQYRNFLLSRFRTNAHATIIILWLSLRHRLTQWLLSLKFEVEIGRKFSLHFWAHVPPT